MGYSRTKILETLLEQNGYTCSICGGHLDKHNCVIDHIYPVSLGGTDNIDNLQLVCNECNYIKLNKTSLGFQFEEYIRLLLDKSSKYDICQIDKGLYNDIIPDLIIKRANDKEYETIVAEIDSSYSLTRERIENLISRLDKFQKNTKNSKKVIIVFSELSDKNVEILKSNDIELWDRNYISNEFKNEILNSDPSYLKSIFSRHIEKNEEKKYQLYIDKLKVCKPGKEEWGNYQRLVGELLELLFCPPLGQPISQKKDKNQHNIKDYIMPNYSQERDVREFLRNQYRADYVVFDAKNSKNSITKQDVLQMSNYLKSKGAGRFGIIFSRKGSGKQSDCQLRDAWQNDNKMIVVLDDDDVEQMIKDKKNDIDPAYYILKKIEDFRLSF